MEVSKAKEYVFYKYDFSGKNLVYISKNLQRLIDLNDGSLAGIYAVLDTNSGEILFDTDWSYSNEPIIMRRFMHKDSWIKFHNDCKFIKI